MITKVITRSLRGTQEISLLKDTNGTWAVAWDGRLDVFEPGEWENPMSQAMSMFNILCWSQDHQRKDG